MYGIFYIFGGYSRVRLVLRCQYVHRKRKSPDLELKYDILRRTQQKAVSRSQADIRSQQLCVVYFLPIYSGRQIRLKYQPGSHRISHPPSAVRAFIFLARRIQPFRSLVDRELELRKNPSYRDSNSRPNGSRGLRGYQLSYPGKKGKKKIKITEKKTLDSC